VRCIERLQGVALGDHVASRWCLLLLEVITFLDALVARCSVTARMEIVLYSGEIALVRGVVLVLWELTNSNSSRSEV
jgi:hypothetical protein